MKKVTVFLIAFFIVSMASANAMSPKPNRWHHQRHPRPAHHNGCRPVGAPLDGGLLVALGAAGFGFYVIKKKKQEPEA